MELNSRKRISLNILFSIIQVILVGIVYLFLYKFLLISLGVEKLGLWSIILATSSIANLANFGITSGLVKFIADYNAKKMMNEIPKLIFTALVSIFVLFILIIFILYFLSKVILVYVIDIKYLDLALEILPYSLLCLFINSLGGVFTSTLEGIQKNYLKTILYILSSIILLFTSYYFVPKFGLKGVAFAQILQSLIIFIGALFILFKSEKLKIFNKWNWNSKIFKELIGYGAKFQVISIFQMLYEPVTKGLISKFGGLTLLGYYEMSARLVNQVRSLIVNANQVMIPVVAHTNSTNKNELVKLYNKTISITYLVNVILISALLIFTPIISDLWIGFLEPIFVFSMFILAITMFINVLVGPAYFSCLGEGKLNLILKSQIMIGILNFILGFLLGSVFLGKGVIISWSISVSISSFYLFYKYQKEKNISYSSLLNTKNLALLLISCIVIYFSNIFYPKLVSYFENIWLVFFLYLIILLLVFIPFLLKNNEVIELKKMVLNKLKK